MKFKLTPFGDPVWQCTSSHGIAEFAGLEFAGLENDGLQNDGVEQEQTYILHAIK